ncbi:MAG TPA: methylated-DNA--[protein]-cysteine S-methyltransferase [Kribbellaceae bacterium]
MTDLTDLETRLSVVAPAAAPPVLPDADVGYAVHETPIGSLLLATAAGRVVASSYDDEETVTRRLARAISPRVLRQPKAVDEVRRQLDEYLAGRRQRFELEVDLALATAFQRQVLTGLASYVPFGRTTTYGALAGEIHRPTAARAIGHALGANPLCIVLPCHRVVGASGALTGYAGGIEAKRFLLELEQRG